MATVLEQLLRRALCGGRGEPPVPSYWEAAATSGKRDSRPRAGKASPPAQIHTDVDAYPVKWEHQASIQELMNERCEAVNAEDVRVDARAAAAPLAAFRLVRAARLENLGLWQRYREGARAVSKVRGRCAFVGGPPATARMARDIDMAGILSDLDPDVCEAYLWYGTDPEDAFKIVHEGFNAVNGQNGQRFRFRFAEDMAEADESAKPGRGLYQDCFAMLLCRLVLGSQEVCGEDGSRKPPPALANYDSELHEAPGRPRKYVPSCTSLVYPEYMLVYERCELGHLEKGAEHSKYWENAARHIERLFRRSASNIPRAVGRVVVPGYWSCWNNEGQFRDLYPAVRFKPVIQRLLDSTWKNKYTRDRKGADGLRLPRGDPSGDMPTGLRVLKVLRVEDSAMWTRYAASLAAISARRGECGSLVGHEAMTMTVLDERERQRLAPSVNEVYLFHGSSPHAVMSIAQAGFDLDLTGSATGAMYGHGAYFAESSAKADEYSKDDKDGYYQGYFAMLLCRVALGEAQHLVEADAEAHRRTGPDAPYDSTLGDREAARGTFREFVVPAQEQIYPEYAVIYERAYGRSRIR